MSIGRTLGRRATGPYARRGISRRFGRLPRGTVAAALLIALLVGTPWALTRYIGWPLPNRVPTWPELQLQLLGPTNTGFLVGTLACACWLAWAAFTADVARCAVAELGRARSRPARHRHRHRRRSPTHALAAVLVGAVVLAILGNRPLARDPRPLLAPLSPAVSTAAPVDAQRSLVLPVAVSGVVETDQLESPVPPRSVIVRPPDPVTGIHDSLWRIAERELGAGTRWPKIFELNRGTPQPGGGAFTRPSLIFPGEELVLPNQGTPPTSSNHHGDPGPPQPSPPPPSPQVDAPTPDAAAPRVPALAPESAAAPGTGSELGAPAERRSEPQDDGRWDPRLFAGLGLAVAVGAALTIVRRRRRRRYLPGSGVRDDLPEAPAVYELRLAHLRDDPDHYPDDVHDWDDDHGGADEHDGDAPPHVEHRGDLVTPASGDAADGPIGPADRVAAASGEARQIALSLAGTRGVGLTGPGAVDAARSLLLTLLAASVAAGRQQRGVEVHGSRADLAELLGGADAPRLDGVLAVYENTDDVLEALESEILNRIDAPASDPDAPVLVLLARPSAENAERLQAVLDNGSVLGVTGLLLGQWRPGGTLLVGRDGVVAATGPGPCEVLRGSQLFTVDIDSVDEILGLLHGVATTCDEPPADAGRSGGGDLGRENADHLEVAATMAANLAAGETSGPDNGQPPRKPMTATRGPEPTNHDTLRHGDANPQETAELALARPIRLAVLGRPRVVWSPDRDGQGEEEITGKFQPRTRELLVYLALHPQGTGRDSLAAALWPDSPPERIANTMNTALTRLRRALHGATDGEIADIVLNTDGRICLNPDLVDVDYWRFDAALAAGRSATSDEQRLAAHQLVVDSYRGELAEGIGAEWIEAAREAVRRDAVDSVAALARALAPDDPQRTLDLLETARAFDPYNELLYRDIMRLQARLDRPDAIARTLTLLSTRLAETGDQPAPGTLDLAHRLQERREPRFGSPAPPQSA